MIQEHIGHQLESDKLGDQLSLRIPKARLRTASNKNTDAGRCWQQRLTTANEIPPAIGMPGGISFAGRVAKSGEGAAACRGAGVQGYLEEPFWSAIV